MIFTLAVATFFAFVFPALAAELGGSNSVLSGILTAVMPHVLELTSLAVTALVAWLAAWLKLKFKIDIEARHREALHSALMTGVRLALARYGVTAKREVVLGAAVDYAREAVPDAIKSLRVDGGKLGEIALSKLGG
ncbi:hypothetical protein LCM4579_00160 [Ensifer sp. LCM 4579]|nr:hypothetical protein LCM4579_00160 [Ensifer sp. LCM 4579]